MRLVLLTLMALTLAGSAAAQEKRISVVAPAAAKAGLRGPETAADRPGDAGTQAVLPLPVAAPAASVDTAACRTACAQSYYFCLSGADDQCPVRWSQCLGGCIAPPQPAG